MENIYLHGIYSFYHQYNSKETLKTLSEILKDNALLSLRLQNKESNYGFNGIDYISLCDYDKRNIVPEEEPEYNAYQNYIRMSLSLMFPKEKLEVITPQIIAISTKTKNGFKKMATLGEKQEERYSDLYDEVQVKDRVSIDLMSGITMPIHLINSPFYSEQKRIDKILEELEKLKKVLLSYGHDIPIYDIDTFLLLDKEDDVKRLVKEQNKKYRSY